MSSLEGSNPDTTHSYHPFHHPEPQTGYSLADADRLQDMVDDLPPFQPFGESDFSGFNSQDHHHHDIDDPPAGGVMKMWPGPGHSPDGDVALGPFAPLPPSVQGDIAKSRDTVGQRYGQVTPPSDGSEEPAKPPTTTTISPKRTKAESEEADAQKLRQERARNAAHTRHARNSTARKARKKSRDAGSGAEEMDEDVGEEGAADGKREIYREKNRLAAAKCRSKKKVSVNHLEDRHRVMSAENNFRRREERELRDELTTLRTMALEHGPGRCNCGGLHRYNQAKAAEMALGHRIGGPAVSMPSPPNDSLNSTLSPLSDTAPGFPGRRASMHGGEDFAHGYRPSKHHHSASMGDAASLGLMGEGDEFPNFVDFLQSSPGGRGAFS